MRLLRSFQLGLAAACFALIAPSPTLAHEDKTIVEETWEAALIQGRKAGHVHFVVREMEQDGKKVLVAVKELRLQIARDNDVAEIAADIGTTELPSGEVVGVMMKQALGKSQNLHLQGVVEGESLKVRIVGPADIERKLPWSPEIVGLAREQRLLREKDAKPGSEFSYLYYEPTINNVVRIRVVVKGIEKTQLTPNGPQLELLHVTSTPDRFLNLQLPASEIWADPKTLTILKTESELPGLGTITMLRTTKEIALRRADRLVNLLAEQSVRLPRPLPGIHGRDTLLVRIRFSDSKLDGIVAADARQKIVESSDRDRQLVLHLKAQRNLAEVEKPDAHPGAEFIESNHFINSNDARVRDYARRAVGTAKEPLIQARLIERWVRENMRSVNYTEAMATADTVARTLEGDCSEFAMLTAAMLRAVGIPSRTAMGLVYAEDAKGPIFAYHMWTEAWIKGQWYGLDATLGRGAIGPGHLKVTDHSWHDTQSFTPLIPINRIIFAKPSIEVIRFD